MNYQHVCDHCRLPIRSSTGFELWSLSCASWQVGFFLNHYAHLWQQHLDRLVHLYSMGVLKVTCSPSTCPVYMLAIVSKHYATSVKSVDSLDSFDIVEILCLYYWSWFCSGVYIEYFSLKKFQWIMWLNMRAFLCVSYVLPAFNFTFS